MFEWIKESGAVNFDKSGLNNVIDAIHQILRGVPVFLEFS
jgi:hypothetical protein